MNMNASLVYGLFSLLVLIALSLSLSLCVCVHAAVHDNEPRWAVLADGR